MAASNHPPVANVDANTLYQGDAVAHGNLIGNDTDVDNNHLTVTGVGAQTSTATVMTEHGVTVQGTYGSVTINADGSYTYNLDNSNTAVHNLDGAPLTDTFSYQISDGHGGYSTSTLNITIGDSKFTTGDNLGKTLDAGNGNDVVVGDYGGTQSVVIPGEKPTNYDVCLILDTSGSMGLFDVDDELAIEVAKDALVNLVNQLKGHAGIVNVKFIGFNESVTLNVAALEGQTNQQTGAYLSNLINSIKNASAGGGTNYEAAFKTAADWFTSSGISGNGHEKLAFFLSDGVPTMRTDTYWDKRQNQYVDYVTRDGDGSQMSEAEFTEAIAEYQRLVNAGVKVNAIGLGSNINQEVLQYFDNTKTGGTTLVTTEFDSWSTNYSDSFTHEGLAGKVEIINTAADLTAALKNGTPDQLTNDPRPIGGDTVNGGAGNNILFADAVNADWLLKETNWPTAAKGNLHAGDSLAIVRAYVLATTLNGTTLTGDALEAAINVAMAHELTINSFAYGMSETTRGGADVLNGGAGDDVLFGQGGNDELNGGTGNDVLAGGTGTDTLSGGAGADIFLFHPGGGHDTITDFNRAEGDVIVRVGKNATFDSITVNHSGTDTTNVIYNVDDIKQGHDVHTDNNAHMLVGSGVDGSHVTYNGGTYDNVLVGGSGDDVIYGGTGNNYLEGGAGKDHIIGGSGDSYLFGGAGDDHLYGGSGNEHLYGGADNDTLDGGAGNDFLDGGTGTNTLSGGEGNDILVHHKDNTDTIHGGKGLDVLLTDDSGANLDTLLSSVNKADSVDVEVAIKSTDASNPASLSLTDLSKLAAVGINISDTTSGTVMTLSSDWSQSGNTFTNAHASLQLTTSNLESTTHDASAEVAKFILTNNNG